MKRKFLIMCLLPLAVQAQKTEIDRHYLEYKQPKFKEYVPSLAFFAGAAGFKAFRDASLFYRIKNGGFFDGRESWKRKYKNGDYLQGPAFPLSTTVLVGFTDNVHFSPMMQGQCEAWGNVMMPYDPNKRFTHKLAIVGAKTGLEALVSFIVLDIIFKNGNRREIR